MKSNSKLATAFLSGGGEMGNQIRSLDWAKTSLGAVETWPQSLRSALSICLNSNFPIAIYWGKELTLIYNDAWSPIPGNKHPWALGKPATEVWPEIWADIEPQFKKAFNGEPGGSKDALLPMERHGYVEECYFDFTFTPIYGEEGKVEGVFNAVIETTKTILNERQLLTLRQLSVIDTSTMSLDEMFIILAKALEQNNKDFPFAVIYKINKQDSTASAVGFSGIEKDQTVFPSSISCNEADKDSGAFIKAFSSGKILVTENNGKGKNLPTGHWDKEATHFVYIPITIQGDDQPIAVIAAALNPYRKFDESYLQFAQLIADQISMKANSVLVIEQATTKAKVLADIDKAKTAFFSNISHEFRTPITLMLGPLENLLNNRSTSFIEDERVSLETTHRNALRLLKLVNTLLDFSKVESGRQEVLFELVDLVDLTSDLASNFRSISEKTGVDLIIKADTFIQPVYLDKGMYEKILFNLLSNAFKYTLKGSVIVRFQNDKKAVKLIIEDTGVGIPEKELPKMFERFYRADNVTQRSFEGTGIGLSLVKELVKLQGGNISVESKEGKGSLFIVELPFGKDHIKSSQLPLEHIEKDTTVSTYILDFDNLVDLDTQMLDRDAISLIKEGTPTVLVVDDNPDMRQYISNLLKTNYNVVGAANGLDALLKLEEYKIDLVLSDIMMPIKDGYEFLKESKSNPKTKLIPVILLTARAGEESRTEGYQIGADDYLVKPFSSKELLNRIKFHLENAEIKNTSLLAVESERNRLYQLFIQAPAMISVVRGKDFIYEFANPVYLNMVNRTEEIIGKSVFAIFPELVGEPIEKILRDVYETGVAFHGDEILIKLDADNDGIAEDTFFNFVYQPFVNKDGMVDGVMSHAINVTEQVKRKNEIKESEKLFRNLAETLPNLVWITDEKGNQEYVSKRWLEYSGIDPQNSETWADLVHPEDLSTIAGAWSHSLQTGERYDAEVRLRSKEGEYFLHSVAGEPIKDAHGKIIKWCGAFTNLNRGKILSA
ncbi:MAG: response regulator [Bacteroidota bacterium]